MAFTVLLFGVSAASTPGYNILPSPKEVLLYGLSAAAMPGYLLRPVPTTVLLYGLSANAMPGQLNLPVVDDNRTILRISDSLTNTCVVDDPPNGSVVVEDS